MKTKISAILSTFIVVMFFVSCGPSKEDAIKYNDKIIYEQRKVVDSENDFIRYIKTGTISNDKLDENYNSLSKQVEESIAIVNKIDAFDGKTDLKDATLQFFSVYKSVVDKEYKEWVLNLKTPLDQVDQKVMDEEKLIVKTINNKLDNANSIYKIAQNNFAVKYKFEIAKDK
jgi:hypothetical protein